MFWGFLLGSGLFIYWLEEIYMMLNCIWLSKRQPSVVQNFKYCIVLLHRGEGSGGSGKGIELLYWKNKYWKKLVLAAGEQKWSCIWTSHSPVWVMNCRSQKRGKYLSRHTALSCINIHTIAVTKANLLVTQGPLAHVWVFSIDFSVSSLLWPVYTS